MPVQQQLANYVQTTLASGCTNIATSLSVVSAAGFPTTGNFMLRIDDPAPATTFEYVECTAVSGTTLTVTRGQEGTTGVAHSAGAFVGNDLTAAMLVRSFPLGVLVGGFAQVTANQGTFTAQTDLTGLAVTVTLLAGRRYKLTGVAPFNSSVSSDTLQFLLIDTSGPTTLQSAVQVLDSNMMILSAIVAPGAGSKTYKLAASRFTGSGNITMQASVNQPAFILIEDIGQA